MQWVGDIKASCGPWGGSYLAVGRAMICFGEVRVGTPGMVWKKPAKRYEPAYGPVGSAALRTLLSVQQRRAQLYRAQESTRQADGSEKTECADAVV